MADRQIVPTGQHIQVDPVDRIPDYDPRAGNHLWSMTGLWQVDPQQWSSGDASITPFLDHENLLSIAGPGCFYCEQVYTPLLASRRRGGQLMADPKPAPQPAPTPRPPTPSRPPTAPRIRCDPGHHPSPATDRRAPWPHRTGWPNWPPCWPPGSATTIRPPTPDGWPPNCPIRAIGSGWRSCSGWTLRVLQCCG
jgi:hypothetical protein